MEKRQLIEEIRQINTTASARFLMQFDAEDLQQYLNHLREAKVRNVRPSRPVQTSERIAV